jgi:hypothetical protein
MLDAKKWTIRTPSGETLFRGTKAECEDWLDWNENNGRHQVELEPPVTTDEFRGGRHPRRA